MIHPLIRCTCSFFIVRKKFLIFSFICNLIRCHTFTISCRNIHSNFFHKVTVHFQITGRRCIMQNISMIFIHRIHTCPGIFDNILYNRKISNFRCIQSKRYTFFRHIINAGWIFCQFTDHTI